MNKITRALVLAIPIGVGSLAFLAGCELIVDFDRTRIPAEVSDSSLQPRDVQVDTSVADAATDATADVVTDATPDSAPDSAPDAADAATADAADGSTDAADASD